MANKDMKINLRIDRTDEHYLSALVKRTTATPSDVIRALIRNVRGWLDNPHTEGGKDADEQHEQHGQHEPRN